MATLAEMRTQMASGHKKMADKIGKTVALHKGDSASAVSGGTGLSAIVREASEKDLRFFSEHFGVRPQRIIEIAKQGTVDLTVVTVHKFKIKFGGVFYEIQAITNDECETEADGLTDSAVFVFAAAREKKGGIGEIAFS